MSSPSRGRCLSALALAITSATCLLPVLTARAEPPAGPS